MSYTPGTALGRLRERLGDTDVEKEVYDDVYLLELIENESSMKTCVIKGLRRLLLDPGMLRRKFRLQGQVNLNILGNFLRIIEEMIRHEIEEGDDEDERQASDSAFEQDAEVTTVGISTDEDGWYERSTLDSYLQNLRGRR